MSCFVKAILAVLVIVAPVCLAEGIHLDPASKSRSFFDGKQGPLDACTVIRGAVPKRAPSAPVNYPPPVEYEGPTGKVSDCPESCPPEGDILACTFKAITDDILDTVSRAGAGECFIKRLICEELSNRSGIASPVGGKGPSVKTFQGKPDKLEKENCVVVAKEPGACGLKPKDSDPKCSGTLGGPMTFFYDKQLKVCVSYQNLGSCDASGSFGSLEACKKAVADKKCE